MKTSSAVIGNLLSGSLGRIINSLGPILLVPLMVRTWGLEIYGEWILLTAIPAYIMLSPDFGLAGAVVNQLASLTAQEEYTKASLLYRTTWVVLGIASATFVVIGAIFSGSINWHYFGVVELVYPVPAGVVFWSCVQIFLMQQAFLLSGIYRSACQNPRYGMITSLGSLFVFIVGIIALTGQSSPLMFALAQAGAKALLVLVLFFDSQRVMPLYRLGFKGISFRHVRPYIVPGLGHAGMPLVYAFQNQGVILVLGALLGSTSVAIFQTVRVLTNGVKSLIGIFSAAIGVELSFLLGSERRDSVKWLLVRNSQLALLLVLISILILGPFGEKVYSLWLGAAAVYRSELVLFLLISLIPFAVANSFSVLLLANNKIHLAVLPLLLCSMLSVALIAAGSYFMGLVGIGIGILFYEFSVAYVVMDISFKNTFLDGKDYIDIFFDKESVYKDIRKVFLSRLASSKKF